MNNDKRGILIGMTLGDGYIALTKRPDRSRLPEASLRIKHSIAQEAYLKHKADLLHSALGGKSPKIAHFNNNGYPGVKISKSNKYFRILHNWIYHDGKKSISRRILDMLTPEGVALWYQDDGGLSAKKKDGKIHAFELFLNTHLSREENQVIIDYFGETWGIQFGQVKNRGLYRLRCGTIEARKFVSLVEKHIIPEMRYKIDMTR